ncbi:MAG: amidohydrolase family protein [Deltaproteobacteria bacterium]|nr:amidohydrolase family protein [Deltaproteobacteria bacterium]
MNPSDARPSTTSPRRRVLKRALGVVGGGLLAGCSPLFRKAVLAGPAKPAPFGVKSFVRKTFDGLNRALVWDSHVHIIGNGKSGSGAYVNPSYREGVYKSFLYDYYMASGGVLEDETADDDFIKRTLSLHRLANPTGKLIMLAFDVRVEEDGEENLEHTEFAVPNALAKKVADANVDVKWGCSVHPYRKNAVDLLEEAIADGAVCMKWLPNAMGIDPSSPKCDALYEVLAKHDLPLLVHAGEEQAADSEGSQSLGDVLRLRRPLDAGVKIVVAHCAGLGEGEDIDKGDGSKANSFGLMIRLLEEKQYEGRLFADISAMTQFNRSGAPLREIILRQDLHKRLVNGSDYPLPSLNMLISTRLLEKRGYLTKHERQMCNEVFKVNPLLFDFVVKRSLKVRHEGKIYKFSDEVFESGRVFARS